MSDAEMENDTAASTAAAPAADELAPANESAADDDEAAPANDASHDAPTPPPVPVPTITKRRERKKLKLSGHHPYLSKRQKITYIEFFPTLKDGVDWLSQKSIKEYYPPQPRYGGRQPPMSLLLDAANDNDRRLVTCWWRSMTKTEQTEICNDLKMFYRSFATSNDKLDAEALEKIRLIRQNYMFGERSSKKQSMATNTHQEGTPTKRGRKRKADTNYAKLNKNQHDVNAAMLSGGKPRIADGPKAEQAYQAKPNDKSVHHNGMLTVQAGQIPTYLIKAMQKAAEERGDDFLVIGPNQDPPPYSTGHAMIQLFYSTY